MGSYIFRSVGNCFVEDSKKCIGDEELFARLGNKLIFGVSIFHLYGYSACHLFSVSFFSRVLLLSAKRFTY